MIKKILIVFMILISAICIVFCGNLVKKSEIFEPYPEKVLLNDSSARPVYEMLDETEKSIYSALYNGVAAKKTEIPLPCEVSGDVYSKVYCIFEKQEAGFFYIDSTYYTAEKIRNAQIVFREDVNSADPKIAEFENIVQSVAADAPDGDYEKALYIHDYIIDNCSYNIGYDMQYSPTAYGCLVEKQANCEGYAKAFSYLAGKMGLKCVLVTGKTNKGENHAWNQVQIDGDWYNIDVTWDDRDSGNARKVYFLCSDADFGKTHIAENTYFKPFECTTAENNYYIKNGLFAADNSGAAAVIRREIFSGKNTIDLKFSDFKAYSDFKREYIDEQKIFDIILESGSYSDGQIAVSLHETADECCMTLTFS